jgi:hypothetical protein
VCSASSRFLCGYSASSIVGSGGHRPNSFVCFAARVQSFIGGSLGRGYRNCQTFAASPAEPGRSLWLLESRGCVVWSPSRAFRSERHRSAGVGLPRGALSAPHAAPGPPSTTRVCKCTRPRETPLGAVQAPKSHGSEVEVDAATHDVLGVADGTCQCAGIVRQIRIGDCIALTAKVKRRGIRPSRSTGERTSRRDRRGISRKEADNGQIGLKSVAYIFVIVIVGLVPQLQKITGYPCHFGNRSKATNRSHR